MIATPLDVITLVQRHFARSTDELLLPPEDIATWFRCFRDPGPSCIASLSPQGGRRDEKYVAQSIFRMQG